MPGEFPRIESKEFRGMGTTLGVLLVVNDEEEVTRSIVDIVVAQSMYVRFEKIFSRFDPESELSHINASLGKPVVASGAMLEVARKALTYHDTYAGLYDPRIITALEASGYARDFQKKDFSPSGTLASYDVSRTLAEDLIVSDETVTFHKRMDFAGIVKGYVTDRVAQFLTAQGWTNFLVDSGGDMYASGKPHDSEAWHITVEGVRDGQLVFALSHMAVATSGISRRQWERGGKRFHHLINPKNPDQFSFDVSTISVIASSTEAADVLAKILFIQNDEERKAYIETQKLAVLILYTDQTLWMSLAARPYCLYI
jgi:thiamine biosynthesis lipoprotein